MHTKSHKPQNDGVKPFWLDLWHLPLIHLPQPIRILGLTLLIKLKGWGTGVPHLGGPIQLHGKTRLHEFPQNMRTNIRWINQAGVSSPSRLHQMIKWETVNYSRHKVLQARPLEPTVIKPKGLAQAQAHMQPQTMAQPMTWSNIINDL